MVSLAKRCPLCFSSVRIGANWLFLKKGACSVWVNRELGREPERTFLIDPDVLFSSPRCVVIKDQRKIKVGRTSLEIGGRTYAIFLKRYNAFSWRYRIGSIFGASGALRSLGGATILLQAGFLTGRPIAAIEYRSRGMLTKSFYLSEEIRESKLLDVYWREELVPLRDQCGFRRRRRFLRNLAELLGSLHRMNIYHNDLKDANILVRLDGETRKEAFFLLDLEGVRKYRHLNRRRRMKNLVQLNRTMGRFLDVPQKLFLLKSYLGDAFFDRNKKKRWIRDVLAESKRQDQRSLRKSIGL